MAQTKPEGGVDMGDGDNEALISASEDIISAILAKDASQLAVALRAAFEMCDMDENGMPRGGIDR